MNAADLAQRFYRNLYRLGQVIQALGEQNGRAMDTWLKGKAGPLSGPGTVLNYARRMIRTELDLGARVMKRLDLPVLEPGSAGPCARAQINPILTRLVPVSKPLSSRCEAKKPILISVWSDDNWEMHRNLITEYVHNMRAAELFANWAMAESYNVTAEPHQIEALQTSFQNCRSSLRWGFTCSAGTMTGAFKLYRPDMSALEVRELVTKYDPAQAADLVFQRDFGDECKGSVMNVTR